MGQIRIGILSLAVAVLAGLALLLAGIDLQKSARRSGFLGLEFAPLTRAAQGRAPFLTQGGALVVKVVRGSPAAAAHFSAGMIVTAINSEQVASATDAAELLRSKPPGERIVLKFYDLEHNGSHALTAEVALAAAPPKDNTVFNVEPPRTLAREWDFEPSMAAGASWSKEIARGAANPLPLKLFSRGRCGALAPEDWTISGSAPDGRSFELVSFALRTRAAFDVMTVAARAQVEAAVDRAIARFARISPEAGPPATVEGGYAVVDFGSANGYAGFALYHVRPRGMTGLIVSIWIVAVPASNVAGLAPLVGSVALSIRCDSALAEPHRPYDNVLASTSVSERCLKNDCDETDFAGAYNQEMHTGYVHAANADNFLIDPRRDVWATGPNGPGTYRQVGGMLEKLEPGRTN